MEKINTIIDFVKDWQTLLGSVLTISIALLIEPIRRYIKKRKEHKETLREIEIYTTQIINDLFETFKSWISFIKKIEDESSKEFDGQAGILIVNKPNVAPISYNGYLIKRKTNDVILHNFLINLDRWVRNFNLLEKEINVYNELQEDFKLQQRLNSSNLIQMITDYRLELAKYADFIKQYIYESIRNGVEVATIVKKII